MSGRGTQKRRQRVGAGLAALLILAMSGCQTAPAGMTSLDARPTTALVQTPSGQSPLASSNTTSSERQQVCMQFGFGGSRSGKALVGGLLVIAAPLIITYLVLSPFTMILGRITSR